MTAVPSIAFILDGSKASLLVPREKQSPSAAGRMSAAIFRKSASVGSSYVGDAADLALAPEQAVVTNSGIRSR